jgi:hypothetical protein
MPSTYEPIATTTLGALATTITFSSIPATYTDLRVVWIGKSETGTPDLRIRYNNDTASNYSNTGVWGDGSAAYSFRQTSQTSFILEFGSTTVTNATVPTLREIDVFNYTSTSVFKTALAKTSGDLNGSGGAGGAVGLWRNTAAINRIDLNTGTTNMAIGTIATLYGIKNA